MKSKRSQHTAEVFNVCMACLDIGTPQVIDALTNTGYIRPESRERLEEIGDLIANEVPETLDSAIDDFIENNMVTQPVTNIHPIDERFVTITRAEKKEIFGRGVCEGWEDFRARYPHTRGTLVFDIRFDDAYAQAILYVGQQLGGLAGRGMVYVFQRKKSKWSKLGEVRTWIS